MLRAEQTLDARQLRLAIALVAAAACGVLLNPLTTVTLLVAAATVLYLATLAYRVRIFGESLGAVHSATATDEEARAMWSRGLPLYTVLVAAYREPAVIGNLIRALDEIDYPHDRLDVQILLEEDDLETLRAVESVAPGPHVSVVRVPYAEPRTKPRALNYGLQRARGRFVTVYDAEDIPDPLQLRRAVHAFRRMPLDVACLQAKLSYHNASQNLLTRWFTVEYDMWFSQLLPGMVACGAPLPLGGTSNHFRRTTLELVGGWDPHNVTEDADLGIRLHRLGFRTEVLDSTTMEEANSDFVNWAKQRSRWYKGYWQTWLVHTRNPALLVHQLGWRGAAAFTLFVAGTPMLALLNPVFWALTLLWFLAEPAVIEAVFPPAVYYAGMASLVLGNLVILYMTLIAARLSRRPELVFASLLVPVYWAMMSVAAIKALMQLISAPSFWEKTVHGLDREESVEMPRHAAL